MLSNNTNKDGLQYSWQLLFIHVTTKVVSFVGFMRIYSSSNGLNEIDTDGINSVTKAGG